jgi:TPP-dependent pyruvate/acetoin dehydrogenase alpha subunit
MCAAVDLPFIELRGNDVVDYREQLVAAKATVEGSGPVCIEVHLKTMTNHSGPTPGWDTDPRYVSLDDGLKVEQSSDDPVHVLEALVPSATMAELTEQVFAEEFAGYRRGEQP